MKVVNVRQRSPEWLLWRQGGISASDAPAIMGVSDYTTPWRLWGEKKGRLIRRDISKNPYVARGVRLEDTVRKWYEQTTSCGPLLPICCEQDANPLFRASLDGLDDQNCPVEFKVPSESVLVDVIANKEQSKAYRLYRIQVMHQIMVTASPYGHLVFYDADNKDRNQVFRIDRDQALIDEIMKREMVFWDQLTRDIEPEKDKARDLFVPDPNQMVEWATRATSLARAKTEIAVHAAQVKEWQKTVDADEAALVNLMGDFMIAESMGVRVTRYAVSGGVEYAKVLKDLAPGVTQDQIESYRKPPREQVRVTVQSEGQSLRVPTAEETVALGDLEESFYL